jgi:hypothetical protein
MATTTSVMSYKAKTREKRKETLMRWLCRTLLVEEMTTCQTSM